MSTYIVDLCTNITKKVENRMYIIIIIIIIIKDASY